MNDFLISLLVILNQMSPYILLGFFIAGLLHAFVPSLIMSRHFSGRGFAPVLKAALFGVPLPLCSCGVLPTAIALRLHGASKSATTSFLIATPQTGVDSIAATYSLLGLPFAIIRPVAALLGSLFGGWLVEKTDDHSEDFVHVEQYSVAKSISFLGKLKSAIVYGFIDMVASVGRWLVIGLVIAALITVFVPDTFFMGLSDYPLLAMLAVLIVAIPMYICATGSIPIAMSLMLKGLSPGIAFVMLMAGPAANFASIIMLSRTMGKKTTIIYVVSITITAVVFGLLIDLLMPRDWFLLPMSCGECTEHDFSVFSSICSAVLVVLLILAPRILDRKGKHNHSKLDKMNSNILLNETLTIRVEGMACPHCKARVEETVLALEGVTGASVDLSAKTLTVSGNNLNKDAIMQAITQAGYKPSQLPS